MQDPHSRGSQHSLGKLTISNHKYLQGKDIVLKETPIPEIGENEILVKVRAVGLNPIDVSSRSNPFSSF